MLLNLKRKNVLIFLAAVPVLAVAAVAVLYFNGSIQLNMPDKTKYPVRGVDVSEYQGNIDWELLKSQEISFAFIKATEGSSYVDPLYEKNAENALKTELPIGSYHFFSYDSAGKTQAENFIDTVSITQLPPVVDVEFYGQYRKTPKAPESVIPELSEFIALLETEYGRKPIIYTTSRAYSMYVADNFPDCDVWIRNVLCEPSLPEAADFRFWQYSSTYCLKGYDGKENFIDMNVFNGSFEEFYSYINAS